jgi:hypothetical protein
MKPSNLPLKFQFNFDEGKQRPDNGAAGFQGFSVMPTDA